ncbi:MAG TPA: Flp1 family type IVb pilin [Pseudobacteroides sp.]|uniref:Flp1 family type IVb pilin n=1 Tax=Pseudobacteroides sp. TaxID=1968840 RepID=UPI002F950691
MRSLIKSFLKEEDGLGTVEIVIIIAVLVGLAIIFREVIFSFLKQILGKLFEGSEEPLNKPSGSEIPSYNIKATP